MKFACWPKEQLDVLLLGKKHVSRVAYITGIVLTTKAKIFLHNHQGDLASCERIFVLACCCQVWNAFHSSQTLLCVVTRSLFGNSGESAKRDGWLVGFRVNVYGLALADLSWERCIGKYAAQAPEHAEHNVVTGNHGRHISTCTRKALSALRHKP